MRTIKIKGVFRNSEVRLFDSIKELSIERYRELKNLSLQDIGIGSDIDSVAEHFSRLHTLLTNEKTTEALQEAKNLHNNFYYMIEKIDIKSFCFVAMIESINGKNIYDFSEEGVKKTIKKLSDLGLKQIQVNDIVEDVKKNLTKNFNPIFLIDTEIPNYLMSLKK